MKPIILLLFILQLSKCAMAQTPDTAPWCPPGASWVYRLFSIGDSRYHQYTYVKDTMIVGKIAKQLKVKLIVFLGPNNESRNVSDVGFEYLYNSNDSIYFLDSGSFRFIYDFTPQTGDKWIIGSTKIFCPIPGYPAQDTITVDSIRQRTIGTRVYDYIYNNSFYRKYNLGVVIKNIASTEALFPFVNRNSCNSSNGFYQGLTCYSDDIRGFVPVNNAFSISCNNIITSLPNVTVYRQLLVLYPNPVLHTLYIKTENYNKVFYMVFDGSGKNILSGKLTNNGIDVSKLQSGIYFISVNSASMKISTSKFIKL